MQTETQNTPFFSRVHQNPLVEWLRKLNWANIFVYLVLGLISYQFVYPLLRMFTMSFMSPADILNPAVNWIPRSLSLENMEMALRVMNLTTTMFNSLWFSGLLALAQTLVSAMTGFALARFNVKFKTFWFMLIMVTFVLPAPVLLVTRIMMIVGFGEFFNGLFSDLTQTTVTTFTIFGTVWPQIALAFLGQGMFSAILILIFYNFTRMIPPALDESAAIDGANSMQIFYHVILKLSFTTLLVIFLLSFVWNWNETYVTGTLLQGGLDLVTGRLSDFGAVFAQEAQNLQMGGETGGVTMGEMRLNEAYRMAGTLVAVTPLFVLYLLVQRHFIKGIENTGLTGL